MNWMTICMGAQISQNLGQGCTNPRLPSQLNFAHWLLIVQCHQFGTFIVSSFWNRRCFEKLCTSDLGAISNF